VDCFTSDPDSLSPREGCRSTATKAVLDGIEDTMYRFGRRGRLGDEASSIRFLAKSVPRIGRLAMTLVLAIATPPRRRSVSMSCARAPVWTTVEVYGIRCLLPALHMRDFA
jgi:hypothetical protein